MTTERERRLGQAMIGQLPALRRYAIGLSGSVAAADDLVQDCIERGLRRLATCQGEDRMAAWLRTILFNAFIDDRRRWRSRRETDEPEVIEFVMDRAAQPDTQEELAETLRAMASLTPQHRQALLLVGVEGLSYREAAQELGLPIGTIMSRLARARDQLRQTLEAGGPAARRPG